MQLHYLLSKQLSSDKFRWPHKVPLLRQISHKRDFSSKEGYNDKKICSRFFIRHFFFPDVLHSTIGMGSI